MIVAVDAAGGDYYPKSPVEGALLALEADNELQVILIGPEDIISKELAGKKWDSGRLHIQHAPDIVDMHESASSALKSKPNSSIAVGISLHKAGKCDAFVSAGNTGALLAASMFVLGKLPGVIRPTIASNYPTVKGFRLLVDAGANLELKPETALQFAQMASVFAEAVLNVEGPKVGLLNVGEEKEKGTDLHREIFAKLETLPNFVGNIEGRDILSAKADIFVSDGFVGNIVLKLGESFPEGIGMMIKSAVLAGNLSQEDAKVAQKALGIALSPFNYENVGGIPFLGVNGISIVGHGGSSPLAIKNMIFGAVSCVKADLNSKIIKILN